MAIFLRLMLILIPIAALLLWLRWRMKRDLDEETRNAEFKRLRIGLTVLVVVTLAAGLGLRFIDDGAGDVDSTYVPARVEDGKVIPGYYIPKDDAEKKDGKEAEPDKGGGGPGGTSN